MLQMGKMYFWSPDQNIKRNHHAILLRKRSPSSSRSNREIPGPNRATRKKWSVRLLEWFAHGFWKKLHTPKNRKG